MVNKVNCGSDTARARKINSERWGWLSIWIPLKKPLGRKILNFWGIKSPCLYRKNPSTGILERRFLSSEYDYLEWYEEFPYTFSQRFVELALWLSDLTAVDGCLLLDHKFTVLGFGVEIQVPSFEDEMVYRALDIEAQHCVLESMESAGTRHRTAYRLCREYAECLAVVISQDGAVKFVANYQDKVTYWNHLDF